MGPAIVGSTNVFINGRPALRVDDVGIHAVCCGSNTWAAQQGSATVFINGKAAFRKNDPTRHCGGTGKLIEGSEDVVVGDASGGGGGGGGAGRSGGGGTSADAAVSASKPVAASAAAEGKPAADDAAASAPPSDEPKSTLSVALVDAAGSPIGSAAVRIDPAPGASSDQTLGPDGTLTLQQVPPGAYDVSFPDLDTPPPTLLPSTFAGDVDVSRRRLTRRDNKKIFVVGDGSSLTVQLERRHATVIELEHFHRQGAVLLPGADPNPLPKHDSDEDERVIGTAALAGALGRVRAGSGEKVIVTGHAAPPDARRRSGDRALNACLALTADDGWAAHAASVARVEDAQSVLTWASVAFDLDCDPGGVDDQFGPLTNRAYRHFIDGYAKLTLSGRRSATPTRADIGSDGRGHVAMWAAFFDLYLEDIARWLEVDSSDDVRALAKSVAFVAGGDTPPAPPPSDPNEIDAPPHGGRPLHYPYLRIASDNSLYPAQLSRHAKGEGRDADYLRDLNPLNPHLCPDGVHWKPMLAPRDEINLPADYVDGLRKHPGQHYHIVEKPGSSPVVSGRAIACQAHHLEGPFADSKARRGLVRRAEIVFVSDSQAPLSSDDGKPRVCLGDEPVCTSDHCDLYDPREYELTYVALDPVALPEDQDPPPEIISYQVYLTPELVDGDPSGDAYAARVTALEAEAVDRVAAPPRRLVTLRWQIGGKFRAASISGIGDVIPITDSDGVGRRVVIADTDAPAPLDFVLRVTPLRDSDAVREAKVTVELPIEKKIAATPFAKPLPSRCGHQPYWKSFEFIDIANFLQFHGVLEHIAVQADFMLQRALRPRAEYYIPGAAKSGSGNPGFADVVALAPDGAGKRRIWEIKPRPSLVSPDYDAIAASEAAFYVQKANIACGAQHAVGIGYHTLLGNDTVLKMTFGSTTVELRARQGLPGSILYHWVVNGQEQVGVLSAALDFKVRRRMMQRLLGVRITSESQQLTKEQLPRYLPLVFRPEDVLSALALNSDTLQVDRGLLQTITGNLTRDLRQQGQAELYPEGWTAVALLPAAAYDRIVGTAQEWAHEQLLQVRTNPQQVLERTALESILLLHAGGQLIAVGGAVAAGAGAGVTVTVGSVEAVGTLATASTEGTGAAAAFAGDAAASMNAARTGVQLAELPMEWTMGAANDVGGISQAAAFMPLAFTRVGLPQAQPGAPTQVQSITRIDPQFMFFGPSERDAHSLQDQLTIRGEIWRVVGIARTPVSDDVEELGD